MRLLKLVPENTNIHFLKWRNIAMAISMLMIIASIALVAVRGLNLGVDFVGGQSVRVTFAETADLADIRERVDSLGLGDAIVQNFGADNVVQIRTPVPNAEDEGASAKAGERLQEVIRQGYPDAVFDSVQTVSGKVSGELLHSGVYAMVFAMIAIAIYIWFRFEWQFGLGALFALLHDVALTFGFFALTQLEFNLNIVAAILTIIGYSLNDTIVVYDRMRENLRKYRKMEVIAVLDLSVNETLARTIMTSLTMIIALLAMLIWGPEVIFGFVAAMLLGIFIGTYSSIYMAAPILVWARVRSDSFVPKKAGSGGAERIEATGPSGE